MQESETHGELRRKAAAAAEAIYRLSGVPSFESALRVALRTHSIEVLTAAAGLFSYAGRERIAACERLSASALGLGELMCFARGLGAVAPDHADRVIGAYRRIAECAGIVSTEAAGAAPRTRARSVPEPRDLNARQRKILTYLDASGEVQIGNIKRLFGEECSKKTLQRDVWQLVSFGMVRRQGDNRWTTYTYIGHSMSDTSIS